MTPSELFKRLFEIGAIKIDTRPGHGFRMRLHNTQPEAPLSPIYLNLRTPDNPKPGPLTPELVADIGWALWEAAEEADLAGHGYDGICGIPYAGEPLADAFNQAGFAASGSNRAPMLKLEKSPGIATNSFAGIVDDDGLDSVNLTESRQNVVLLIDDVIIASDTKLEVLKTFDSAGYEVRDILVFCDRQQGGVDRLARSGIRVHSAFQLSHIVEELRRVGVTSEEDCNRVLAYLIHTPS